MFVLSIAVEFSHDLAGKASWFCRKRRGASGSSTSGQFQNGEKELLDHWTIHYFKDIVPYHSFANTSPPKTASPTLRRVPIRKYSANRSFNSGNLAIDFPVRISPTIEGD